MMRRMTRVSLCLIVLTVLLSGCSFFKRSKSSFFSLERIAPASAPLTARGNPFGLDVVELPPGFDRREVVVRKADHQLEIRSNEQWSASLQPLVLHTLAFDLASRLPEGMVVLPGDVKPVNATRGIDVVFAEIAAGPEAAVTIDAQWVLRQTGAADFTKRERIVVPIANLDSASIAAGTSTALAQLADAIAAQLAR